MYLGGIKKLEEELKRTELESFYERDLPKKLRELYGKINIDTDIKKEGNYEMRKIMAYRNKPSEIYIIKDNLKSSDHYLSLIIASLPNIKDPKEIIKSIDELLGYNTNGEIIDKIELR